MAFSRWTLRRRLREGGLTPHRRVHGPELTPAHLQARLREGNTLIGLWSNGRLFSPRTSVKLIFMVMTYAEESIEETENVSHKSALKKGSHLAVTRGQSVAAFPMTERLYCFRF